MYSCYKLTESSRNLLLEKFPPKYPVVICHHITEQYPVKSKNDKPEDSDDIYVIGYLDNGEGLKCLLVSVNGKTERPDGKKYHITLSLDNMLGYKPVDSNELISKAKQYKHTGKIKINATSEVL